MVSSDFARKVTIHLGELYPEEDASALTRKCIDAIGIDGTQASIESRQSLWDSADIVLITYADSVVSSNQTPLDTINYLLSRYLKETVSDYVKSQIERQFGEKGKKLSVVARGVDTDVFDPAAVAQSRVIRFVDTIALPEDQPVIMLPARPTGWKGHEILLGALAKIADRPFNCVLLGAADGKPAFVDRLTQTGMKLGLEGRFRLTHGVDDMPAALMAADIVVMPSVTPEPFGRVSLEAQAMGRLVVAFDHGGAAESIVHGKTGWLATPVEEDSLAQCLAKALDFTAKQRKTMALETRSHIEANFSAELMCSRTVAIYARLLKARHQSGK